MILKSTFLMLGARGGNAVCAFLIVLVTSRVLGPEHFGVLVFLSAVVLMAMPLVTFGLDLWLVRETARHPESGKELLAQSIQAKLATSVGTWGLLAAVFYPLPLKANTYPLLLLFSTSLVFNGLAQSLWHFADGYKRFQYHSFLWLGTNILKTGVATVLALMFRDLEILIWGLVAAEALGLAISWGIIQKVFGTWKGSSKTSWPTVLRQNWDMGLVTLFGALHFRLGLAMLTLLATAEMAGWYGASFRFVEFFTLLPHSLFLVLFPHFSQAFREAPEAISEQVKPTLLPLIMTGATCSILLYVLADPIIRLMFGPEYAPAVASLQVLSPLLFLIGMNYLFSNLLLSMDAERQYLTFLVGATLVSLILNLALIPELGIVGAAWATVGSEGLLFLLAGISAYRLLNDTRTTLNGAQGQ